MNFFYLVVVLIFNLVSFSAKSQCIADGGPDLTICNYPQGIPSVQLGGNPSAVAGTPPFTYSWQTSYTVAMGSVIYNYFASDFLDDTTVANPNFTNIIGDSLYFILTVTDSDNFTCSDTVFVRVSHFMIHLGQFNFTIQQGDSLFISPGSNVTSSNPPVTYLWQPTYGLSDTTSLSFWVKPDSSVAYSVAITDSLGCVVNGGTFVFVNVIPVSIQENNNNVLPVVLESNIFYDCINITNNSAEDLTFYLLSADGRLLNRKMLKEKDINIPLNISGGIYFYKIFNKKGDSKTGKLIKL